MQRREEFNRMIADCKAGLIDLIITKSVSRFARNVRDFIGVVRDLADLNPSVGVFFESECIFSLNDDSQMALTFQATMAEEESHTRSRSMEASLRMRLDNGLPLTPKLYGYTHDIEGNLIVHPDEAPTVKLIFYMYLYGYSSKQIAETLFKLERKRYYGTINWTANGVTAILRNERHCGAVLTRKTFTIDYRTHRKRKNNGERPQSWYYNHHEPIVSHEDFIAVQHLINNAKYKNGGVLPELRVIDSGLLKGYVVLNPRWSGFKENDYLDAAYSVRSNESSDEAAEELFSVESGSFDMRGFEVARSELFDISNRYSVTVSAENIVFSRGCIHRFGDCSFAEILINPIDGKLAIRPTQETNRSKVIISRKDRHLRIPRSVPCSAFRETLFKLFGWNTAYKYRTIGTLLESGNEFACVFDISDTEALIKPYMYQTDDQNDEMAPFKAPGNYIRCINEKKSGEFGKQYYYAERSYSALQNQSEEEWKLYIDGRIVDGSLKLKVTDFSILRAFIDSELQGLEMEGNEYGT